MSARRRPPGEPTPPEDEARLYGRALRLLAAHDRTVFDLTRRLEGHAEPAVVARVVARLTAHHYLDDRRFAETFTDREAFERGGGARLVRAGLRAHGVDEGLVAQAAERAGDAEEETAMALARKAAARLRALAPEVRVRRLAGQLARRGYRPAVVYRVVRAALAQDRLDEAGEAALESLALMDDPVGGLSEEGPRPEPGDG